MPGVPVLGTATRRCPPRCYFWPARGLCTAATTAGGQQLLPFSFPFPQRRGMDGDRMRNPPSVGSNLSLSWDLPRSPVLLPLGAGAVPLFGGRL